MIQVKSSNQKVEVKDSTIAIQEGRFGKVQQPVVENLDTKDGDVKDSLIYEEPLDVNLFAEKIEVSPKTEKVNIDNDSSKIKKEAKKRGRPKKDQSK
mgnify:CR=1 FL=1